MATLAEIGGRVSIEESHRGSLANIAITDQESGETRSYALPHTGLNIHDGDMIAKGTALNQGALNPHDILRIRGISSVQNYLIQEVLKVYRQQGVDINDKHIEVIVRQMMRKGAWRKLAIPRCSPVPWRISLRWKTPTRQWLSARRRRKARGW